VVDSRVGQSDELVKCRKWEKGDNMSDELLLHDFRAMEDCTHRFRQTELRAADVT
jgi:hypothetical protein